MKKIILLLGISFILNSCQKQDNFLQKDITNKNSSKINAESKDSLNFDAMGLYIYDYIRKHSKHVDVFHLVPSNEKIYLKAKFDSVLATKINPNYIQIWEKELKNKKIGDNQYKSLIEYDKNIKNYFLKPNFDENDFDLFQNVEILKIKNNKSLDIFEKEKIVKQQTIVKYILKAYLDSFLKTKISKSAKISESSCISTFASCVYNSTTSWVTYGNYASPPSNGQQGGGLVGGLFGFFYGLFNCQCPSTPCQATATISTQDKCYDIYAGIDFNLAGFGNIDVNTDGFRLNIYSNSTLTNLITTKVSPYSNIHVDNSELQGNTLLYIQVITNCKGVLLYANRIVVFDINALGKPNFYITGNSNPPINSSQYYNLVGRNINNANWTIYTYGPTNGYINATQPNYGASINWNGIPGFANLYVTASSPCGTYNSNMYITTKN
jgi:hypothetical protein